MIYGEKIAIGQKRGLYFWQNKCSLLESDFPFYLREMFSKYSWYFNNWVLSLTLILTAATFSIILSFQKHNHQNEWKCNLMSAKTNYLASSHTVNRHQPWEQCVLHSLLHLACNNRISKDQLNVRLDSKEYVDLLHTMSWLKG